MSRYSVKKPYTVLVAMVLILVLGIVSFTSMTTDLLPSMELNYAVVMTTYAGASPEEVETVVTEPIESAMSTVSNIQNVSSVSSENYSLVILEFAESANMDSVSLEMRESLDQISSFWDDSIGSPIIMKLNPDMLPVMVAAVDVEGLTSTEITKYVSDQVVPEIESLEGVASVSTTGDIEESIQVILSQEKIDAVNEKIKTALDDQFAEGQTELDDARKELTDSQTELDRGKEQLDAAKNQALDQIAQGQEQLENAQQEVLLGEAQLDTQTAMLAEKEAELTQLEEVISQAETKLAETETNISQSASQIDEGIKALEQMKSLISSLDAGAEAVNSQLGSVSQNQLPFPFEPLKKIEKRSDVDDNIASINQMVSDIDSLLGSPIPDDVKVQLEQTKAQLNSLLSGYSGLGQLWDTMIQAGMLASGDSVPVNTQITAKITELEASRAGLETARQELAQGRQKVSDLKNQLSTGKAQLAEGKAALEDAKAKVAEGKITVNEALAELSKNQALASIEMSVNQAKLDAADLQLEAGMTQLDSAQEQFDQTKEDAYEQADMEQVLTADMIKTILTAQNFSMPAGYVTEEGIDYLVRVGDELTDVEELKSLVLMDPGIEGVDPVRLEDVADVFETDNSSQVYAKINGNPGIMLTIQKQTGYSTGDVSKRIKAEFEALEEADESLRITRLMDQGIYIDLVVDSVLNNMLSGAVLAILVLLLFLKDWKPTVVIAFSIPMSVLAAVVLMYFSGITLNIISLSGLALGIGMLVDNSIVVIENIYRMRSQGLSAKKAAVEGAKQVSAAIFSSTLTTVSVFLPIVFTEGITRQLFVDMGLTIGYSLMASLFIALTLVPAMASKILNKPQKEKKSVLFDRVQEAYGKGIALALKWKPLVLIAALVLMIVSIPLSLSRGTAFMPEAESTQTTITMTVEEGTPFEELTGMADTAAERLLEISDVETVGVMTSGNTMSMMAGGSAGTGTDATSLVMYLQMKEEKEHTNAQLDKMFAESLQDLNCEIQISSSSMDLSALGGSGISIMVKGRDLDKLQTIAKDLAKILEGVEGVQEVSDGVEETTGELRIVVDKNAASQYNLTVAQVYQLVAQKVAGASTATTISDDVSDRDVVVSDGKNENIDRQDIRDMTITVTGTDQEEKEIPLSEIVTFTDANTLPSINRDSNSRYVTVSASVDGDHNVGLVSQDVNRALEGYQMPEGYTMEMSGENETIMESMTELLKMLGLAVIFIYLIMVAQFQSLLSPFIIMFTMPLAFTGGFFGLYLTGNEVSVISMIGFVMLAGIIVNNGIVLVDYINQLRQGGMDKKEAMIEAGKTRLKPILMTALTTILGLSTMAAGVGMGSDMMQPMAIVVIGGLLYGTFMTLFVVPCVYDIFNRKKSMVEEEI